MSGLFPDLPSSGRSVASPPAREWVMPARGLRGDHAHTCKALPHGMPDCLEVQIMHSAEGTERTTAAIYGAHAYLVHFEFKPRQRA